jgi:hypothetical protein
MSCRWLFFASPQFCGKPGHPYCAEHQCEIDAMKQAEEDWREILATHEALCEEPAEEEQKLCAMCNDRPVHDDCVYCEVCCADDALGILGPQG